MIRGTFALGLISLILLPGCTSRTDSSWHTQTVDMGKAGSLLNLGYGGHDVGQASSLAIDGQGHPHISYLHVENLDQFGGPSYVKYAAWTGSGWDIKTVGGTFGDFTSLALDSQGYPHTSSWGWYDDYSWYDDGTWYDEDTLCYAAWNGSSWDIQPVDSEGDENRSVSLVLDSGGHAHMAYADYHNNGVKYTTWNASSWDIQTVDTGQDYASDVSWAIDSSGYAHISYSFGYGELKYAHSHDSGWNIEVVDSVGGSSSLAIDGSERPHISYAGYGSGLKYATWNGSSWDIQTVDRRGNFPSLALDSDGRPHISYSISRRMGMHSDLKYAVWNGSSWDIQTLDRPGNFPSLALDSSGWAHISYLDEGKVYNLKYATNAPSYRAQTRTKSK